VPISQKTHVVCTLSETLYDGVVTLVAGIHCGLFNNKSSIK